MPFLEIAYQAEISRYEDAEFEEVARLNCDETPENRDKAIRELKRLLQERCECIPRRMDDAYMLRFLRCRKFIPALAHKLMVRYEQFRSSSSHLYACEAFELGRVKRVYAGTLADSREHGRITLMRFGKWNTDEVPIEDVVRCALLMDEVAVMQPKLQILGVTIIVDLDGLSLRHVRQLTPTIAGQIVALYGASFPLPLRGLHFINYNWMFHTFSPIFKQFIPRAAYDRIHFHGCDVNSLQKQIHPKHLPPEYGGHCKYTISIEEWISKIKKYKDDFLVQELRALGFIVKD